MDQAEHDEMRAEIESGECYTIDHKGRIHCGRRWIGTENEERPQATFELIREHAEREQFWPGVYRINDHGNVDVLDYKGNIVGGWV